MVWRECNHGGETRLVFSSGRQVGAPYRSHLSWHSVVVLDKRQGWCVSVVDRIAARMLRERGRQGRGTRCSCNRTARYCSASQAASASHEPRTEAAIIAPPQWLDKGDYEFSAKSAARKGIMSREKEAP